MNFSRIEQIAIFLTKHAFLLLTFSTNVLLAVTLNNYINKSIFLKEGWIHKNLTFNTLRLESKTYFKIKQHYLFEIKKSHNIGRHLKNISMAIFIKIITQ